MTICRAVLLNKSATLEAYQYFYSVFLGKMIGMTSVIP